MIHRLFNFIHSMGIQDLTFSHIIMWIIGITLMYLAIKREFEPLLLLPIGFGIFLVNLPHTELMEKGGLLNIFHHYGIEWELIPPLIFLGLGAMTDFGPLIADPKNMLLGAAAQLGVFTTLMSSLILGFSLPEGCSIGIIGGADGPTTIYITTILAPHLLGTNAIAAYSYMAMVPIIQPPIVKILTTQKERTIVMKQLRPVSRLEKVIFPLLICLIICLVVPKAAPLIGMFMMGNLFRESGVVRRLSSVAQNELMNILTIFLGVCIGANMPAEHFLKLQSLIIFILGLVAFSFGTAGGVLMAKLINLLFRDKINPLIGAAGVSAVPMAARVSHRLAQEANPNNFLLMHAMGPNVAGVIGTIVVAGLFLALVK